MMPSTLFRFSLRPCPRIFALTVVVLALSSAGMLAQQEKDSKSARAKSTTTPKPTATQPTAATPKPAPTPDTKIDAKMEAELLQAEERFVISIQNRDSKALDELLHPYYADSMHGGERAFNKRSAMQRLSAHRLPAYRVEKERKLIRSGDSFTVEGMAIDAAHGDSDDTPNKWVHVLRLWMKEGDRWIATAQVVTPEEQWDEEKEREAEAKEKKP
jgi:hypothetical protein